MGFLLGGASVLKVIDIGVVYVVFEDIFFTSATGVSVSFFIFEVSF